MQSDPIKTRLVRFKIPRYITCPFCNMRQPFKKEKEHYKLVKDINLDQPVLLKVRVVYAKCRNPECGHPSFALPTPGIDKYQRSTQRLKNEAVAGVISDNSTCPRIAAEAQPYF